MYTLLRLISIFSVMMLVACGGGSSEESQPSPQVPQPSPQVPQSTLTTKSQVIIDPTVPTTLSGKITNVISPLSTLSSLNGSIETTDQEALVFALNADDEIVMAGIAVGKKETVFSADSTALALVRMAMTLPDSLNEKNFYVDVRKAKSFSLLVSAVKSCFDKGLLAAEDASVAGLILAVVDEVGESISSSKSSTSSSAVGVVVSPLPTSPSLEIPGSYEVIKKGFALGQGSVFVTSGKELFNTVPIAWDVQVTSYKGANLPGGDFLLPASNLSAQLATAVRDYGLLGFTADYFLSKKLVVPDDHGSSVYLNVYQSPRSRTANLTAFYFDLIKAAMGQLPEKCVAAAVKPLIDSTGLASVASSGNSDDYNANIRKLKTPTVVNSLLNSYAFVNNCVTERYSAKVLSRYLAIYFFRQATLIGKLYDAYKVADKLNNAYSLALRFDLIFLKQKTADDGKVTICIGKSGSVTNCAVRFEHDPKDFVMVAGDTISPPLKALDIHNNQTLMSNTIKASGNNSFVTVDENAAIYSALYDGESEITIKDIATNAPPSVLKVEAVQPIFNKDKYSLNVGGGELGSLVDSKGRTIVASSFKSLFDFSSNNSVVDFALNGTLNFLIRANKHGEATIKAKNKITGHESLATVTVSCPAGFDPMADGTCKEKNNITGAVLMVNDVVANWTGLPAEITLSDLMLGDIHAFENTGNSSTCGTGERGTPLFSGLIDQSASFYSAKTIQGMPTRSSFPSSINRNNCSSFVAIKDIADPSDATKPTKQRIWINATGRAWGINASAGVTYDWEYQVRYDSGDPFNGFGKSCSIGVVPNAGVFVKDFSSSNCTVILK